MTIRVFMVDDHALVRAGMRMILSGETDIEVVGETSPFDLLSPRELEVAMLLVQGMRQEEIAKRLSLSAKTVNTHKSRLFEKLGIQDSIALARLSSQYGLSDPARVV